MPDDQYTDAQLSDGTTLRFQGQLNPDQVRGKVQDYKLKTGAGMEHPPSSAVPEGLKAETGRREEPHVKQQIAALGPAEYAREAPERQAAGKAAIGGEMSLAGAGLTLADLGIIPGLKVLAGGALGSEGGGWGGRKLGNMVGHPQSGERIGSLLGGLVGGMGAAKIGLPEQIESKLPWNWQSPQMQGSTIDQARNEMFTDRGDFMAKGYKPTPISPMGPTRINPEQVEMNNPPPSPYGPTRVNPEHIEAMNPPTVYGPTRVNPEQVEEPDLRIHGIRPGAPGVNIIPEPRGEFQGENTGYMASVPRKELNPLAMSAKPGAGKQLQNLGKIVLYAPPEEQIPRSKTTF